MAYDWRDVAKARGYDPKDFYWTVNPNTLGGTALVVQYKNSDATEAAFVMDLNTHMYTANLMIEKLIRKL